MTYMIGWLGVNGTFNTNYHLGHIVPASNLRIWHPGSVCYYPGQVRRKVRGQSSRSQNDKFWYGCSQQ